MSYSTNECPRAKTNRVLMYTVIGLILPMNVRELKLVGVDSEITRRLILPMNVRELKRFHVDCLSAFSLILPMNVRELKPPRAHISV